jgi:hypothetical protein
MVFAFGLDGNMEVKGWEFLHMEKIGPRVERVLSSKGMLRNSPLDSKWRLVPRGVAVLVLGMVADQIAQHRGFDAVTDQPLAFAINALYNCTGHGNSHLEGIVASTVASVHVPKAIALLSPAEYAELRKRHADVRQEFGRFVHELKEGARLARVTKPAEFRSRIDEITMSVDKELRKFRISKQAAKFNDWVPFLMTTLIPVAATIVFGPVPGLVTTGFTFTVNAAARAAKKTAHFSHPRVLQTLCAAQDLSWRAEIRRLQ